MPGAADRVRRIHRQHLADHHPVEKHPQGDQPLLHRGLLRELAGVEIGAKQVERAAESLGAEIAAAEHERVEKIGEVTPTMYLGMDGTGVPMRPEEAAHRAGKQADGSAKTREAKLVTVWNAESRDEEGKPVRDPGSVTYSAAIESAATPDTSPELSEKSRFSGCGSAVDG